MVSVLILSGGASRRMGQDKASLIIDRETNLLSFQASRFRRAGFPVVSELPDQFSGRLGPLAGIHAACHLHRQVEQWLVVPVDMPQLSVAAIESLIATGQRHNAVTCFEECPLPVFLPNTPEILQTLEQWLADAQGKRSVYALVEHLNGHWLPSQNFKRELVNINTPEQWQEFINGETSNVACRKVI